MPEKPRGKLREKIDLVLAWAALTSVIVGGYMLFSSSFYSKPEPRTRRAETDFIEPEPGYESFYEDAGLPDGCIDGACTYPGP